MAESRRAVTAALVGVIALAGVAGLHHATRWGVGITPDSVVYVSAARGLLDGRGFANPSSKNDEFRPVTRFPPLYPATLAAAGLLGFDPLHSARPLGYLLLVCNVGLVGFGLFRASRGRIATTLAGAALTAGSAQLLEAHGHALSEPLFLLLGFSGALVLVAYLEEPRRTRLFVAAGLTALAFLTRYAGAAFVASGVLALLLVGSGSMQRRLRDGAVFAAIAVVPMVIWIARNLAIGSTGTGRQLAYHPIRNSNLEMGLATMGEWLGASGPLAWVLAAVIVSGAVYGLLRGDDGRRLEPFPAVLLAFIVVYPSFLAVSLTFFDAHTLLNGRIMTPLLVALLLLVPYAIDRAARGIPGRAGGLLFTALAVGLVAITTLGAFRWVRTTAIGGLEGFTSRKWHDSELIQYLAALPQGVTIYTNGPDALYIHAGRRARYLPARMDPGSNTPKPGYGRALAEVAYALRDEDAIVAWFDRITWRRYRASPKDLRERMPLRRIEKLADGSIWVHANRVSPADES